MQTRKPVGEMGILVHNEPVPVLQITTVFIMEYQINKVFFHMCRFSTIIEMKKPIYVTIGYLGTYFRTYTRAVLWQPFFHCNAWVKDVCLIFLCESITRVITFTWMCHFSVHCPKPRHLTYTILFIFKEENFLPNEELSLWSICW